MMAGRKPDLRVATTDLAYSCGALTLAVAALAKTPVGHDACITPGLPDMLPDLSDRALGPSLDQATTHSNSRALTAGKREAQEPGAATTAQDTEQPALPDRQYKGVKQEDLSHHDRDTHTDQEQEQEEQVSQPASKRPRVLDARAAMQEEEAALEAHNRSLEKQLMAAIKEITAVNRQNISMCRALSLAGAHSAAAAAEPGGPTTGSFTQAAAAAQGSSGGGGGGSCVGTASQEAAAAAAAVSQQGTACTVSNTVSNAQQQGGAVAARQLMAGPGWGCGGDSTPVLQQLQGIADQHSVVQPPKQFAQRRLPGAQQQRPKGVSLLVGAAQKQRPDEEQPQ